MRRIIVVGSQGSGKTNLSRNLGRKLELPVVHLDVLYWQPGWKASDTASFRVRVADAIAGDEWIVRSHTRARRDFGRHRPPALALPVAHSLALGLRSRHDAARPAGGMSGAIRLEIDAGSVAL
jgi:hypothetical protein